MITKQFFVSLFFSLLFLFSACNSHVTTPEPTTLPATPEATQKEVHSETTETGTEKESTPPPTLAVEEAKDSPSTPAPTNEPSQQTGEPDIIEDVLRVRYVAEGYKVECVLPSTFDLGGQLALLPNGDVVINDFSFKRLRILSNGNLSTLVSQGEVQTKAVAVMPDGRVCYVNSNNNLILIEPNTLIKETLGVIPPGEYIQALAVDSNGIIYTATGNNRLFQFTKDHEWVVITNDLTFERISDLDIAQDGMIYVAGWKYFVAVDPEGNVNILTDDLHLAPTWCEVAPDDSVYIKDLSSIWRIDSVTGELIPVKTNINTGVCDLLALSDNEFLFSTWGSQVMYRYNLTTGEAVPIIVNAVNHRAFAAGPDDDVFLASHSLDSVLSYNIIRVRANGTKQSVSGLTFDDIQAADVDKEGRLNIYADRCFYRFEPDGTVNIFTPKFSVGQNLFGPTNFAVGPDGLFYCITRTQDTIKIWSADETGKVTLLPISFNRASFGNPYSLGDARIDIGSDGRLALVVTALGTKGQGPFYQRVYQANADGTDLREVANFDSRRTEGLVDIALDDDNNIFVLVLGEGPTGSRVGEVIYRISSDMEISAFIELGPGRDPPSIDVDSEGNVWFCTTVGVFRITRSQ